MNDFRCQWCGTYTANIVDLQMHIFDCRLIDAVSAETTSAVENTQELNILLEVLAEDTTIDQPSHSSGDESLSVNSDDTGTTDEFDDEDIDEMMLEYSMGVPDTDEDDVSGNKEDEGREKEVEVEKEVTTKEEGPEEGEEKEKEKEEEEKEANTDKAGEEEEKEKEEEEKEANVEKEREGKDEEHVELEKEASTEKESEWEKKGQEREEEKKATAEVGYIDVLRYLDKKEKEEIENVREEGRKRISEAEEKMAKCQQEVNSARMKFEKEKNHLNRMVKEKHEELEKKNESLVVMKDEINVVMTDLDRSKSLLEKRDSDLHEMEERMNEKNRAFEEELKGKEEKIKLLEENLSQLRDERIRMRNEKKVSERKGGEDEINLKDFHKEFQDFKTVVLSQLKHQEKEEDRPKSNNEKKDKPDKPLLEEIAPWAAHSNGFASKYMEKQGHQPGLGLGKMANGIVKPISAEKRTFATNKYPTWPKNTVLIAGDSMIGGVQGKRMSSRFNVQVRSHPGATTIDMHDHLSALLRKRPDHLILHAATNDAVDVDTCADDIFDRLMDLKAFAESRVPGIKVTLSCPTLRTDDGMANAKLVQVKNRLKRSGVCIISNECISYDDLSLVGLHLKPSGTRKLAGNMIAHMRRL